MKMYVTFPGPMEKRVIESLKKEVKKKCCIEIRPLLFEGDDQMCYFEVDKRNEMPVVEAIHSLGDFQCAFDVPKFENGEWRNFYE